MLIITIKIYPTNIKMIVKIDKAIFIFVLCHINYKNILQHLEILALNIRRDLAESGVDVAVKIGSRYYGVMYLWIWC